MNSERLGGLKRGGQAVYETRDRKRQIGRAKGAQMAKRAVLVAHLVQQRRKSQANRWNIRPVIKNLA